MDGHDWKLRSPIEYQNRPPNPRRILPSVRNAVYGSNFSCEVTSFSSHLKGLMDNNFVKETGQGHKFLRREFVLGLPADVHNNPVKATPSTKLTGASAGGDIGLVETPGSHDGVKSFRFYGDGDLLVGRKVSKKFGGATFMGKVLSFDSIYDWYKYEDGDEEDLEWSELEPIMVKSTKSRNRRSLFSLTRAKRASSSDSEASQSTNGINGISSEKDQSFPDYREIEEHKLPTDDQTFSSPIYDDSISSPAMAAKKRAAETKRKRMQRIREEKAIVSSRISCYEGNKNTLSTGTGHERFKTNDGSECSSSRNALLHKRGLSLVGRKIRRDFCGQSYDGYIIDYDCITSFYTVRYEDGDLEKLKWSELESAIIPNEQKCFLSKNAICAWRQAEFVKVISETTSDTAAKHALLSHDGDANSNDLQKPISFLGEESDHGSQVKDLFIEPARTPCESAHITSSPCALAAVCFASLADAENIEYFCWGEVSGFDKSNCPRLQAEELLPTCLPILQLAASQHHLVAITGSGQVWLWRNRHDSMHIHCNEWEHISCLEEKQVVLVDIAGPDLDRISCGYELDQNDQISDSFYLVAVGADGDDYILHGSQPHEPVQTCNLNDEPKFCSLYSCLTQKLMMQEAVGKVVQISVGMVMEPDESPFIGYITDMDRIYIRSATNNYMEDVNLVTGYTGRPIKIQCGRAYHAIILTDDGHAWLWGNGCFNYMESISHFGFVSSTCQPALGTLVGQKVIDVGCYGSDFIALTSDGNVHQWTHGMTNPASGVYNVPIIPLESRRPSIPHDEKLVQVSIGVGMCAGITDGGRVHTWRTAMKGGLANKALTPLGREEDQKDTCMHSLGNHRAERVIAEEGSLIIIARKRSRRRLFRRTK
ncbi:uncharacterized protein LOC18443927 isoform X2 [Amborella trichopoda]|uniref:uncharacterized protein LOC18443927 isoform X2 n=1 Tax=Amborella trichopoda TaxID=13333 RepID=UPI0009BCD916|nr:uncharacterized protein LOC18443927 isoform X2 [Amborella trichopoda]|eukprot:XP_020528981.1 uncharacterized protein LOC18443927 isoform X2 [Amborella trichopoda]